MIDLSVIVLIYNMEKLLPRCLESLEKQTKKGIQFILVDDGSSDSSGKICDCWHPQEHSVKIIHKKNGGVVEGWIDGVNAADGEYVGFVDSDDYIDNNMYEILWKPIKENNVDISMCNHLYEINGNLNPCKNMLNDGLYDGEKLIKLKSLIFPKLAESYLSPSLCNKVFRKKLFQQNFKFCDTRATIADDVSIVLPTLFSASSLYYQGNALYHYVVREGSVTNTYKRDMYFQHELLIENLHRAVEYYKPSLEPTTFDMFVCTMGNQWLRMLVKARIPVKEKKKNLVQFYNDQRYVSAAKSIELLPLNKWSRVYCDVILKHQYWKYSSMIKLLQIREKLKGI